ncbi:glycosyltransferase [Verrucomicrobiota bacterium]
MTVSGLTILKNAVLLDYPFRESIRSILPICDELIVVVGNSDDGTVEAVKDINESKIRIVATEWSSRVQPGDRAITQQTNIGLHMCRGDWVVYLQANEVMHEDSLQRLTELMQEHKDNKTVEAMLVERLTFWGDYNHFVRVYPERHKYTARVVRPYIGTYSIRDAMSFGVFDGFSLRGRYPRCLDTGEDVFRYGMVLTPEQLKTKYDHAVHYVGKPYTDYFYTAMPRSFLQEYNGSHPKVMKDRIQAFDQKISLDDPRRRTKATLKERQRLIETWYYERFGVPRFRNTRYNLVGGYRRKARRPAGVEVQS